MNLLNLEHITKSFTDHKLFDDADFSLQDGEKVGIIGINGTGKSTLLKMIAGIVEPDEGTITKANHVCIRFLPQVPVFEQGATVLECILKDNITEENKWSIEADAKAMCNELEIPDVHEVVDHLSGGQRKRIALAATLLSPAEILILDEPTNHLDSRMAEWLEEYLKKMKHALIMVTHDRYFLDSVSNRIVEIDKGKIYSYQTNYSGFLQEKAQREEIAIASERKRQSILRVEIEWMMRGARARSTKQKAHIQRYEELAAQEKPKFDQTVELSSASTRMGNTTIELEHISKAYGDKVLCKDFTYTFLRKDRIGFIGENGCGKSTLMKMIQGIVEPDEGNITIGQTIQIGYYAQEIETNKEAGLAFMDPTLRVIDYIRNTAEYVNTEEGQVSATKMLERFLFSPEKQYTLIEKLSGGEKRRLNLLRVLMEAPNVLILDEPTNDLDISTLTILEDYLDHFDGIVIAVSHDRYFLDRIVKRIFAFEENGKVAQYEGNYTDYQIRKMKMLAEKEEDQKKAAAKKSAETANTSKSWKENAPKKLKFTFAEQRDWDNIEGEISKLEEQMDEIDVEMGNCASDFVKLNELTQKKIEIENLLEEKMDRWMYLTELKERIDNQ